MSVLEIFGTLLYAPVCAAVTPALISGTLVSLALGRRLGGRLAEGGFALAVHKVVARRGVIGRPREGQLGVQRGGQCSRRPVARRRFRGRRQRIRASPLARRLAWSRRRRARRSAWRSTRLPAQPLPSPQAADQLREPDTEGKVNRLGT